MQHDWIARLLQFHQALDLPRHGASWASMDVLKETRGWVGWPNHTAGFRDAKPSNAMNHLVNWDRKNTGGPWCTIIKFMKYFLWSSWWFSLIVDGETLDPWPSELAGQTNTRVWAGLNRDLMRLPRCAVLLFQLEGRTVKLLNGTKVYAQRGPA